MFGNGFCNGCNGGNGCSATDFVTDVTEVTDVRKFGNGFARTDVTDVTDVRKKLKDLFPFPLYPSRNRRQA
ncbi:MULTISPECIES: hypothetical protein [Microcoleaceae]|uniref:hypothetical protein n=1 Tax=Microcoleaceae TaxID=1892252 RepID=UPI00187EDDF1|nr:hypothetical protein [Tychonema sp. LEGE 06208]MBE9162171.1 hypothetical protein [Tychonema sp. LEGE 06208]